MIPQQQTAKNVSWCFSLYHGLKLHKVSYTAEQPVDRIMTLTKQWRYLNLTIIRFYALFLMRGIVSCKQIISTRLCVSFKKNLFTRWPGTFKHRLIN